MNKRPQFILPSKAQFDRLRARDSIPEPAITDRTYTFPIVLDDEDSGESLIIDVFVRESDLSRGTER